MRQRGVVPHVAEYEKGRNQCKKSLRAEEGESEGFRVSQQKRKLVEKVLGWCKLDRMLRQVKLRGLRKVDWLVRLVMTAQNLRRMVSLIYAQEVEGVVSLPPMKGRTERKKTESIPAEQAAKNRRELKLRQPPAFFSSL